MYETKNLQTLRDSDGGSTSTTLSLIHANGSTAALEEDIRRSSRQPDRPGKTEHDHALLNSHLVCLTRYSHSNETADLEEAINYRQTLLFQHLITRMVLKTRPRQASYATFFGFLASLGVFTACYSVTWRTSMKPSPCTIWHSRHIRTHLTDPRPHASGRILHDLSSIRRRRWYIRTLYP